MQRAENRKYHIIYKTTCLINDKFYIGMHSTNDLEDGYLGSGKRLLYSVHKYGKENHVYEILEYLPSREELKLREAVIVNEEMLSKKLCMNIRLGGEGGFEHLTREQLLHACSLGGQSRSKRMEEDLEFGEYIRQAGREGLSKGRRNRKSSYATFTGKSHTEETKQQMSESHIGKHDGEKNSQFGTCWVFSLDSQASKKISKELLEDHLANGWLKGRKYFE